METIKELINKIAAYNPEKIAPIAKRDLIDDLRQLRLSLSTQQDKVVVPEFVAEWIELCKRNATLSECLDGTYPLSGGKWEVISVDEDWIITENNEELLARAWLDGYTVAKEPLYWAVMGVTDYFKCDGKIIVFTREEEAVEVANLIGINTRAEQLESHEYSEDCVLIDELRATI